MLYYADVRELLEKAAERLREDGRLGVPGDVMATIIDRIVMVASESDDLSIDSVDAASNVLVQVIDSVRQAGGSA
jgi:predicted YcjX-like family ATPase